MKSALLIPKEASHPLRQIELQSELSRRQTSALAVAGVNTASIFSFFAS
jgi:hypothetical protein